MDQRADFPILKTKINGHPMVYFDNAATAQKPQAVIKAVSTYYRQSNANVHRSLNPLAAVATELFEKSRDTVAEFIGAEREEIIFTKGTTESINLVAKSWGEKFLQAGDIVILSLAEHHSNIVPWLQLKETKGIVIKYIPLNPDGSWDMSAAKKLLAAPRVRLLAVSQASNVLGIINPVKELIKQAKARNIVTLIDAAQSIAHLQIDVKDLGCDFLAFSGHKLGGPTGIGVLYGRRQLLEIMPPFLGGGDMVSRVTLENFSVKELPYKFEAGTPPIAEAIGLGAACDYLNSIGFKTISEHENRLYAYMLKKLKMLSFTKLLGTAPHQLPIFAFTIDGIHPHDAADLLGQQGIILRAGQHCAQPLHDSLGIPASLRASLSFYNTKEEIDYFVAQLKELHRAFTR